MAIGLVILAVACSGGARATSQGAQSLGGRGAKVGFVFAGLDGKAFTQADIAGRSTVLFVLTTFDPVSQVVAQQLDELLRQHKPRMNVVGVVFEPPENAILVGTYRDALSLHFPLVLADPDTIAGVGVLGRISEVPSAILLDRDGREVLRVAGATLVGRIRSGVDELDALE
jgi:hypothetical protein